MNTTAEILNTTSDYENILLVAHTCAGMSNMRKATEELQKNNERYLWFQSQFKLALEGKE